MANYFEELNSVDLQGKIEKKNGLKYVSWSYAWQEIKKRFPESFYTIYENKDGLFYHTDGKTCWVKTGVTVNDLEHIEYLPIMDFRNKSIPLDNVTSMDVNKAIQRSLTKACARHGLGLYVYAGEDLPEVTDGENNTNIPYPTKTPNNEPPLLAQNEHLGLDDLIENCKNEDELSKLYEENKTTIISNDRLLNMITAKGKSLKGKAA